MPLSIKLKSKPFWYLIPNNSELAVSDSCQRREKTRREKGVERRGREKREREKREERGAEAEEQRAERKIEKSRPEPNQNNKMTQRNQSTSVLK